MSRPPRPIVSRRVSDTPGSPASTPPDPALLDTSVSAGTQPGAPAGWLPPGRWAGWVWALAIGGFFASYSFLFSVVHPLVDTRPCLVKLDDPVMRLVPKIQALFFVTHELYYVFTAMGAAALIARAVRKDEAPLLRFGVALSLQALLRSLTLWLTPLCRATMEPGTIPFLEAPTVDLGFARIPWRMWADNDLLFSGHAGEFFLLHLATRHWPRWARLVFLAFQLAQAFSLVATRGHYTLDIVVAIPCAFFVDALAVGLLRRTGPRAGGRPGPALAVG
jgi:hypothetical protein